MSTDPHFPGDPSAADPENEDDPPFQQDPPFADASPEESSPFSASGDQLSFAWNVARMWIKEHQQASMLGAFALGIFVGAYIRD